MYCLVYCSHITITANNTVRSKFDPTISFIDPHITVVFPFPVTIPEEEVARHIEHVLHHWTPFDTNSQSVVERMVASLVFSLIMTLTTLLLSTLPTPPGVLSKC